VLQQKEGCSFLKKRTKKLLSVRAAPSRGAAGNLQKFFASFFQKRSPSLAFLLIRAGTTA
jgi:hypothetical protein